MYILTHNHVYAHNIHLHEHCMRRDVLRHDTLSFMHRYRSLLLHCDTAFNLPPPRPPPPLPSSSFSFCSRSYFSPLLQLGPIAPGGSAAAALPMVHNADKVAAAAAGASLLLLQVAVKHAGGVFYYKDLVSLEVVLNERAGIASSEYPQRWQAIAPANQAVAPLTGFPLTVAHVESKVWCCMLSCVPILPSPSLRLSVVHSFSLCASFSRSPSHSLSPPLPPSLSLRFLVSPSLCLPVFLSHSILGSPPPTHSHFFSLPLAASIPFSLCFSLSVAVSLCCARARARVRALSLSLSFSLRAYAHAARIYTQVDMCREVGLSITL